MRSVQRSQHGDIIWRQPGKAWNIRTGFQIDAVPGEVIHDIAAVSKRIHDVFEVACVLQSHGVPDLVNARQIYDGVPQEPVAGPNVQTILARRDMALTLVGHRVPPGTARGSPRRSGGTGPVSGRATTS